MHHPRRQNVTTSMVGLKNSHIRKNLTQNGEPQRYSWECRRRRSTCLNFHVLFFKLWFHTITNITRLITTVPACCLQYSASYSALNVRLLQPSCHDETSLLQVVMASTQLDLYLYTLWSVICYAVHYALDSGGESVLRSWIQSHTIFRLRTEHCQLLSHFHRLKLSHSNECPCGTGSQTPNHILQSCPTFDALRRHTWPSPLDAHRKLWGPVETLRQTVDFALLTRLKI